MYPTNIGCVNFSFSEKSHYSFLTKDGVPQGVGQHVTVSFTNGVQACDISYRFHYANGKIQYDSFTDSCFP